MDEPDPKLRIPSEPGADPPAVPSRLTFPFRIAGVALLLIALTRIGVAELLPHSIVSPPPVFPSSVSERSDHQSISSSMQMVELPDRTLRIAYLHCRPDPVGGDSGGRGTIVLLHGHGDRKESQIPIARVMTRRGYRVFIPDLPAHGDSEGEYVTFGVVEGEVISGLIDSLLPLSGQPEVIITWGHSLGGATAIQAAARNGRIDAVVSASTFSSLRAVVPDYFREFLPVYPLLISGERIDAAITEAGRVAGFSVDAASTETAAARLGAPLLVIHGEKDGRVPAEHARRIVDAASGTATLLLIPEADHTDVYLTAGIDSLTSVAIDWIENNTTRTPPH